MHLNAGRTPIVALAFVSFIALGFVLVLGQGFYAVLIGESPLLFGIFLCFFTWMAYLNFFNAYWAFTGSEEIVFLGDQLVYTQRVFILSRSKRYELRNITDPEIHDLSTSIASLVYSVFGINNYSVRFKYKRRTKTIAAKATLMQAETIVEKLKD